MQDSSPDGVCGKEERRPPVAGAFGENAGPGVTLPGDRVECGAVLDVARGLAGQFGGAVPRPGVRQVRGVRQAAGMLRVTGA